MIQPGQKLKDGDYFIPQNISQLISISLCAKVGTNWYKEEFLDEMYVMNIIPTYFSRFHKVIGGDNRTFGKTEYDFPDFKQLCINTFTI